MVDFPLLMLTLLYLFYNIHVFGIHFFALCVQTENHSYLTPFKEIHEAYQSDKPCIEDSNRKRMLMAKT